MKGAVVMYGINNAANLDLTGRVSEFAYQYVYGSIRNNSSKVDKVLGQLNLTYRKGKTKNDIDFIYNIKNNLRTKKNYEKAKFIIFRASFITYIVHTFLRSPLQRFPIKNSRI